MTALQRIVAFALPILVVPVLGIVVGKSLETHLGHDRVLQPIEFKQNLLVCNAYHSKSPMQVRQNGQHIQGQTRGIPFEQCREISTHIRPKDKIDVVFGKSVQGSFEIGDLPAADSVLLLVVEKRDTHSTLLAFQSFAFPVQADGDTANIAVVDTVRENSNLPSLRMEDHLIGKGQSKLLSKRIEQLRFNRVYNVEQGMYDASILEHDDVTGGSGRGRQVAKGSTRTLNLRKNRNYVIFRVSDGKHVRQSLAVYPDLQSGTMRCTVTLITVFFTFLLLEDAMESYPILATMM